MKRFKRTKGHRSGLETAFDKITKLKGFNLTYEDTVLAYHTLPQKKRYTPDWTVRPGWYIESKGRLSSADRKKHLYIKEQHPTVRILIVFQRPQNKLYKGSPTSYGQWATKVGIEWCAVEDVKVWSKFIKEALKHGN